MDKETLRKATGGGRKGIQPALLGGGANSNSGTGMIGGSERSQARLTLREAWGHYGFLVRLNILDNPYRSGLTPFRQAMNAGDMKQASLNYSGVGPDKRLPQINQVNGIGPSKLFANGGSIQSGTAAYSGNPHYVYDSSDYIRYKRLKSVLNTYNDESFGGSNNGSYTFLMNVRN
jgi:hypothetical protein